MEKPRNIVICCDGTGNEITENISNVLKLYQGSFGRPARASRVGRVLRSRRRHAGAARPWTKLKQDAATILGLVTGYGLDDNVLSAYDFLINHYEEGDEIFLFGFTRGAHTVRCWRVDPQGGLSAPAGQSRGLWR